MSGGRCCSKEESITNESLQNRLLDHISQLVVVFVAAAAVVVNYH